MFGLIKTPIKETPPPAETMAFSDLHPGCVIGFGFMPQKIISGRRVAVAEVNSYLFDEDSFIAYRLDNDSADINLIVADQEGDPTGTYLALSQRIEPRLFELLFPHNLPQTWFALEEGGAVEAKPVVLGMPPGWLTSSYTLAVSAKGRFLEGDYRMRRPADRNRLSRPFDYVLLVDEDNEYALEAEKYEDGTMNVFVTVYRPATDIGEITRAPKSPLASVEIIPHIAPTDIAREAAPEAAPEPPKGAGIFTFRTEMKPAAPAKPEESPKADESAKAAESEKPTESKTEESPAAKIPSPEEPPAVEAKKPEAAVDPLGSIALPDVAVKEPRVETAQTETARIEPAQAQTAQAETALAETALAETAQPAAEAEAPKPATVERMPSFSQKKADVETTMALVASIPDITPARSKFGRIQTAGQEREEAPAVLACNVSLAGRLIDEAQRNQMLLSELIRKVIDLPARVKEEVLIPFSLDNAEVAELARRYNLSAADAEGVKGMIIEELQRFVGEKK